MITYSDIDRKIELQYYINEMIIEILSSSDNICTW